MNPKILIAENDLEVVKSLTSYIQEKNWQYHCVSNYKEIFSFLESEPYTILFTELELNNETGKDKLLELRSKHPELIILVASKLNDNNLIQTLFHREEIFDYIIKPTTNYSLQYSIARAVNYQEISSKLDEFTKYENQTFKDIIQIFDWKEELNRNRVDSIASNLIHQINIGFSQGSGFGSLISILSILMSKALYKTDEKMYSIPEKVFNILKDNYSQAIDVMNSLSESQRLIMESERYNQIISIYELKSFFSFCISSLEQFLKIKNHTIVLSNLPEKILNKKIVFSMDKMSLIFQELLINAMKYSQANDHIYILFFFTDKEFEIKIINPAYPNPDGSIGVTGKNEQRVFEPFFRISPVVDDSYQKEKLKFGLGMTVAKKIIELHNGNISIYTLNNNLNKTTQKDVCVWIRFPFWEENK